MSATPLLEVRDLFLSFDTGESVTRVLRGVGFRLGEGQRLALVGESGCGKTVTALSLARLLPEPPARVTGGTIRFRGDDVRAMTAGRLRELRGGGIAYVFQEPATSLNPVMRVGRQIMEAVRFHGREPGLSAEDDAEDLLRRVGIPDPKERLRSYPHEMSGGMQQRVMIAMALASRPAVLVADEPTTALDVTIQAQILELLARVCRESKTALLLITHNLGIVADLAERVAVMYAGIILEEGPAARVLVEPAHPYTRALLRAIPRLGRRDAPLQAIPGTVPDPGDLPPGCPFAPRCAKVRAECSRAEPPKLAIEPDWNVRCPFWK
jgi:peptide/nickel transport system ATP-binding protein/oligopeptide transport system ATP-binding protein